MGLYSGRLIIGRIFASENWGGGGGGGAYFPEGLFLEGLIIGILHYLPSKLFHIFKTPEKLKHQRNSKFVNICWIFFKTGNERNSFPS